MLRKSGFVAMMLFGLCTPVLAAAAAATPAAPAPQIVVLHVEVDASGHVQSAQPVDPNTQADLLRVARAYASKLTLAPARKGGVAVPSETNISLVLALQPAGEGKFALKLKRAVSGPGVVKVGRMGTPNGPGLRGGATIVVSVDVDASGVPNTDSIKTESVQMRETNSFAQARYLEVIRDSIRNSRFEPEKVAGQPVPSRVSLPYRFGMGGSASATAETNQDAYGARQGSYGARREGPPPPAPVLDPATQPVMTSVSGVPDIVLPNIDFRAPAESGG